jgi:hypothetical protein
MSLSARQEYALALSKNYVIYAAHGRSTVSVSSATPADLSKNAKQPAIDAKRPAICVEVKLLQFLNASPALKALRADSTLDATVRSASCRKIVSLLSDQHSPVGTLCLVY